MDRAGPQVKKLSVEELAEVFDIVSKGGTRKDARKANPDRDVNTIYRLYNVSAEFERRNFSTMTPDTSMEIADQVGYSTTVSYVSEIYLKWVEWKQNRGVEQSFKGWMAKNFDRAVIAKIALREDLRNRLQAAFNDGYVILPNHPYGPLEREIIHTFKRRDPRLHDACSDLIVALKDKDRARADLAVEDIFRILGELISL